MKRERKICFYSFKPMAGGFYSSDISLFDLFCLFFFDLLYFQILGLFDCQFILNLTKTFIILLYVSSNRFGKQKILVRLNRLEKVIHIFIVDGGDESYQLRSLMVFHLMMMQFLLPTMVTSKKHEIIWNGNLFDSIIINR